MTPEGTIDHWLQFEGVTLARQFGWQLLLDGRRAFAVIADGQIGVKLPKQRRADLEAAGSVRPLIDREGRQLSEWVSVLDEGLVESLTAESRAFVASLTPRRRRKRTP